MKNLYIAGLLGGSSAMLLIFVVIGKMMGQPMAAQLIGTAAVFVLLIINIKGQRKAGKR